jgi:ArsR family transcriptional regulator, arsenate/arsenite/antimonite-responsive transcriptional repressor
MQFADTNSVVPGPVDVIGPSLALDLSWCVHAINSDYLRSAHPILATLYSENGELCDRTREFWSDGMSCFAELQVLAHHAGALEVTDFSLLRSRAEAALATVPLDLPLASETAEDRSAILIRLELLRGSDGLRRRYFDLLAELWSSIADWWESEGISAVGSSVVEVRRRLERGEKWHQVTTSECEVLVENRPAIIERNENGYPLVLAACALFGRGLYLELPGCTLVGFGVSGAVREARTRTEQVVRPLRALADPTRLAIFEYLMSRSAGVTAIAHAFSLSQPTISAHIKRLREAGLVTAERHGNRLEISVDSATAEALAKELGRLLTNQTDR